MRATDIYDEITGVCECGGKHFLAYDATLIGFANILPNKQLGIGHISKEEQEIHNLAICLQCRKVMVSRSMDATFNAIKTIEKEE